MGTGMSAGGNPGGGDAGSGQHRVLIVEDEHLVAMSLSFMMEDLDHAVCAIASSGAAAIEEATRHKPHLALGDVGLRGGMDGIETAGVLHGMGIPSIILSGEHCPALMERASRAAVLDYVQKPYTLDRLRSALAKVAAHD